LRENKKYANTSDTLPSKPSKWAFGGFGDSPQGHIKNISALENQLI